MISTHSLFSAWILEGAEIDHHQYDEATMDIHTFYSPNAAGEFQKTPYHSHQEISKSVIDGYLNSGFSNSYDVLAVQPYPNLRRTVSSASRLRPSPGRGLHSKSGIINEFDTSKFLMEYSPYQAPEIGSFGLDLDAPIFVTEPYGKGGLYPDYTMPRHYRQGRSSRSNPNKIQVRTKLLSDLLCSLFLS